MSRQSQRQNIAIGQLVGLMLLGFLIYGLAALCVSAYQSVEAQKAADKAMIDNMMGR